MPYYLVAVALFILLKFGFTIADNGDLDFLLKPTDVLVGLLTGSHSVYLSDKGYYHASLNILLNKSCSGFNYWVLCFLVFTYLGVKYFAKPLHKALAIPISLCCAYLLTIFANSSRIFASIVVQSQTFHEVIGIIVYFSFLVLVYYLTEKFLKAFLKKN
jgi:exosortase K